MLKTIFTWFMDWLASKIWSFVSELRKEALASEQTEKVLAEKTKPLLDYIAEVDKKLEQAAAEKRPLTKEEKDEIRRQKIALETDLWNS